MAKFERVGGGSYDVYRPVKDPENNFWVWVGLGVFGLLLLSQCGG